MAKFTRVPEEIENMAKRILAKHHSHLIEAKICYLFRDGSWKSKGKDVLGTAVKVADRDKVLHGYDFLIILNEEMWHMLNHKQQEALLDHELCHCQRDINDDGSPRWYIEGHDVEEFASIIRRHGLWKKDIAHFVSQYQQLSIWDEREATAAATLGSKADIPNNVHVLKPN